MWSFEEIQQRNSDLPIRIKHIIDTGAASEQMLCEAADILDSLSPSQYVLAFAKLPFPLFVKPQQRFAIQVRDGHSVSLQFSHFRLECAERNTFAFTPHQIMPGDRLLGIGTQVRGLMSMWGQHSRYFNNYLLCLSDSGLETANLNPAIFRAKRAPVGWGGTPVDSNAFEGDVVAAASGALVFALGRFLEGYAAARFEDIHPPAQLPGSFVMTAPGRVRYKDIPITPAPLMLRQDYFRSPVSQRQMTKTLRYSRRIFDRYFRHLMSLQALAVKGECALAIIGGITCIEWLLRELLVNPPVSDDDYQPGIFECLRSPLKIKIPPTLEGRLLEVRDTRNDAAHGKPLLRQVSDEQITKYSAVCSTVLELALDLYKEAQIQLKLGLIE